MSFMHLGNSPATQTIDDIQLLVNCLYEGENNSVLELIPRYQEALASAYATSLNTRLHLRLASLKRYEKLLMDEELQKRATQEVSHFVQLVHEEFPFIKVKPQGRFKGFISWFDKGTKILDDGHSIDLQNDTIAFRLVVKCRKGQKLSPSELVETCYSIMNRMITHFISLGYVPCQAEKVRDVISRSSPLLKDKKLYIPDESGIDPYYISLVKDYMLYPKQNGYQSLHAIFRMPNGLTFEVQLRTEEMDKYATEGYNGDHQKYKESKYTHCVVYNPLLVKGKIAEEAGFDSPRIFSF